MRGKRIKIHNLEKLEHRATFINTAKSFPMFPLDIVQYYLKHPFNKPRSGHSTFPF